MGRFRYFFFVAAVIGLYGLWTLVLFPVAADHTSICGFCHAPRAAYQSTRASPHQDIGCLACHRSPGLGGAISSDLGAWRNLTSWVMRRSTRDTRVDNDACLNCHDLVLDGVQQSRSIKMSHREVIDAGWRCADCHGETGHALSEVKRALQRPSMDKCFGCHAANEALGRCRLCHRNQTARRLPSSRESMGPIAHDKTWKNSSRHGTADNAICPTCHKTWFCKNCHNLELPHPDDTWPTEHGDVAAGPGKSTCRQCHEKRFCDSCHKIPMPHMADFTAKHMAGGVKPAICLNCHIRNECLACHATHQRHKARKRAPRQNG